MFHHLPLTGLGFDNGGLHAVQELVVALAANLRTWKVRGSNQVNAALAQQTAVRP
jgi:hypothetical protein